MDGIAERFREAIKETGLSIEGFAQSIDETRVRVTSVLRGRQRMPADMLAKVVEVHAIDANWLIAGKATDPAEINKAIGDRIRLERQRLGMTQQAFTAIAGMTRKSAIRWESGETLPDLKALAALRKVGVDINYLATGEQSAAPAKSDLEVMLRVAARELIDLVRQELTNKTPGESK